MAGSAVDRDAPLRDTPSRPRSVISKDGDQRNHEKTVRGKHDEPGAGRLCSVALGSVKSGRCAARRGLVPARRDYAGALDLRQRESRDGRARAGTDYHEGPGESPVVGSGSGRQPRRLRAAAAERTPPATSPAMPAQSSPPPAELNVQLSPSGRPVAGAAPGLAAAPPSAAGSTGGQVMSSLPSAASPAGPASAEPSVAALPEVAPAPANALRSTAAGPAASRRPEVCRSIPEPPPCSRRRERPRTPR